MSLSGFEDQNAWGAPPAAAATAASADEPSVETALAKERIIKDIISLRDGLRGLLVRVTEVQGETDKLDKENQMLGEYIDNLSACHTGRECETDPT